MSSQDRHSCCICDRSIPMGLLMCAPHWRLVPADLQAKVLRAYGRWQRHTGGAKEALELLSAYRLVRDQAVAAVEAKLNPPEFSGE